MNPEIKARWVKALRSGRYRQGRAMLQTSSGRNCCLGVLCRVMRVEFDGNAGYLPEGAAAKADLGASDQYRLTQINDFDESNFRQIADYIEKNL